MSEYIPSSFKEWND